jgi:DNA polymerase-3 subunit epsilon
LREVVLDTETTGLNPASGHRIVEIGCLELFNHVATGSTFHTYVNPERDVPAEALAVHGLSADFLTAQPRFADIADAFDAFIADSPLVIHNAEFDLGFINAEFERIGRGALALERAIDTVLLARKKFPGAPANLDALCRRFQIDLTERALHGALKDARLLAEVYLELIGGRQQDLGLAANARKDSSGETLNRRPPRPHAPTAEEERSHVQFLEKLSEPIWKL